MRKKTDPWKPYETICEYCGKKGIKTTPIERYLHEKCKKLRSRKVIYKSIVNIRIKNKKETEEYLSKVNKHLIRKFRFCIICNKQFMSEGNHNRICNKCNNLIENKVVYIVKIYKNPNI